MSIFNIPQVAARFFNGPFVKKNVDIMIGLWTGVSLCTVFYIYYFHFTPGVDYKVTEKFGKQYNIVSTYVNEPLNYEEANQYQLYVVANAPR